MDTVDQEKQQLIELYMSIAVDMGVCPPEGTIQAGSLRLSLTKYRDGFLEEIKDRILKRDSNASGIFLHLETGRDADLILDNLYHHDLLGGEDYLQASSLSAALSGYERLFETGVLYRESPAPQQRQQIALMRFVKSLQDRVLLRGINAPQSEGKRSWVISFPVDFLSSLGKETGGNTVWKINDPELVKFIIENPNRVEDIANIVKSRGRDYLPAIEFVLNGGVPAISDGAL